MTNVALCEEDSGVCGVIGIGIERLRSVIDDSMGELGKMK